MVGKRNGTMHAARPFHLELGMSASRLPERSLNSGNEWAANSKDDGSNREYVEPSRDGTKRPSPFQDSVAFVTPSARVRDRSGEMPCVAGHAAAFTDAAISQRVTLFFVCGRVFVPHAAIAITLASSNFPSTLGTRT